MKHIVCSSFLLLFCSLMTYAQGFVTTWKTDNPGSSNANQITIPINTFGNTFNYNVDWGDGNSDTSISTEITHTYSAAGTYTVTITGDFPQIYFNNAGDREKILSVENWGNIQWSSFNAAFRGCSNLHVNATDAPDLSSVVNLISMFEGATLMNESVNHWDVSNVTAMSLMFSNAAAFNQPLNNWNVSNVNVFNLMFNGANSFNQSLNSWNMQSASNTSGMFSNATSYNQPMNNWNMSNVLFMSDMFSFASAFNSDISSWDVSNVQTMAFTFSHATAFNQNISNWNVNAVTTFSGMFLNASSFNQPLSAWNINGVIETKNMFEGAVAFNQDISNWDVSTVTNMNGMFRNATVFDQDISGWNVSNVTSMDATFRDASAFNQDLSNWNVGNVTNMHSLFYDAVSFNQSLGNWNMEAVTVVNDMLRNTVLSTANYDATLIGWSSQNLQSNLSLTASSYYCAGEMARDQIIANFGWTIQDNGSDCNLSDFITTWRTDNPGTSSSDQITIPVNTVGNTFNYNVDWGDGSSDSGVTGNITHTYSAPGTYTVSISGDFPHIHFDNIGDKEKILSVESWGSIQWSSFASAFEGCSNLQVNATDAPDLSSVTNLSAMFKDASSMNGAIDHWDVSNVTILSDMFQNATSFNQPLNSWDVSNVTQTRSMFLGTTVFNQPLNNWDVSNVTQADWMFSEASAFDQSLNSWNTQNLNLATGMFHFAVNYNQSMDSWNTSNIQQMAEMFFNATTFNQPLDAWNISSVINMNSMFKEAADFNQSLGNWNLQSVTDINAMLENAGLSTTNYDNTLIGWNTQTLPMNLSIVVSSNYCLGETARDQIIANYGWTIADEGKDCSVGLSETSAAAHVFALYPNPAHTEFIFDISSIDKGSLKIIDASGRTVTQQTVFNGANTIDVSQLPSGIYTAHIQNEMGVALYQKLIIE